MWLHQEALVVVTRGKTHFWPTLSSSFCPALPLLSLEPVQGTEGQVCVHWTPLLPRGWGQWQQPGMPRKWQWQQQWQTGPLP